MKTFKNILNKLYSEDNKIFAVLSTKRKIDLSLVDDIENEIDTFEEAESDANYLAYEFGDEIINAYEDFQRKYDLDNYIVNGTVTLLEDYAADLKVKLDKLQVAADELGINPNDIYEDYDYLRDRVDDASSLYNDAKDKYREVVEYTGMNNFWN
jgi:hypothetical protein|tara:strand:+ start:439 stop:900 length:462 start_codon:yes stop_codon:yes gene_type:complete